MSPLCSCVISILRTYYTFFVTVQKTQDLWNSFANALGKNLDLPQLNPTIVFLGESNIQGNDNVLLNHILLLFKKFIQDKKNHPARFHFLSFMNYVKEVEKIEQRIAHRKGKLEFHLKKWNPIKHILIFLFTVHSLYSRAHRVRVGDGRIGKGGGWEFRCCVSFFLIKMKICSCVFVNRGIRKQPYVLKWRLNTQ